MNRERHIIAAVPCPVCQAGRGQGCQLSAAGLASAHGRLIIHSPRKAAWQAWRAAAPVDVYVRGLVLYAQSNRAWTALDTLASPGAERHPEAQTVRVSPDEHAALIGLLVGDGWRVE